MADITSLGDPETAVQQGFQSVDDKYKKKLGDQVYKCIRLKSSYATATQSPILKQVINADSTTDKPSLELNVAVQSKDGGAWVNKTVRLDAEAAESGNILTFKQRIGTVDTDERSDFDPYFTKIDESTLKPSFSIEAWDNGSSTKKFGCYGFELGEGAVSVMSEDTARSCLTGYRPNAAIYCCSEIREIQVHGSGNYSDCQNIAKSMPKHF